MTDRANSAPADDASLVAEPRRTWRSVVPILGWLPTYQWKRSGASDLIAGITLAALLIPESMGYAGVAGVPPQIALYAALAAVVGYAIFGGTSMLVVGPAAAASAVSASIVGDFHGDVDPVVLTAALAIASGVLLLVAGALKLGWIVNFISRPVLHAFVAGLAISIIIGQLDGLFGVEVEGESALDKLVDTVRSLGDAHGLTVAVGLGAISALVLLERYAKRVPAAVVVVVVGIALVAIFGLASRGVAVVGEIPQGLPDLSIPDLSETRWLELLAGGTALMLVGFSEGYAAASTVASETGEEVDANQELVAAGSANVAAGVFGGMAVGGSLSKTAASMNAGARSQVTNLVAGLVVLGTLLFLAPLFEDLPEPVLAAIVIVAVLPSANPRRVTSLWAVNRFDFVAGSTTFVLVLVWETLPAMIVGVVLSLAFAVHRLSFPDVIELRVDAGGRFRRTEPGATHQLESIDGVAIVRIEAALLYANSERLLRAVRTLVARRPDLHRVVLDAEMMSDLDASGAEALDAIGDELASAGIDFRLARTHTRARAQILRSGLAERFERQMYSSLTDAVGTPDGG
ncbi:MAG: SulP family inorganic anion transporter [Ilumatobacteraceae bacterium]